MMHYPDLWKRICAEEEETEVIDPGELEDLFDDLMAQDEWRRSIQVPTFSGLRGKRIPHVYLGGYPLAEGNGWNLHHPKRRSLINIWFDSGSFGTYAWQEKDDLAIRSALAKFVSYFEYAL